MNSNDDIGDKSDILTIMLVPLKGCQESQASQVADCKRTGVAARTTTVKYIGERRADSMIIRPQEWHKDKWQWNHKSYQMY